MSHEIFNSPFPQGKYHYGTGIFRQLIMSILLLTVSTPIFSKERITYLILAETVEPIMIVRDGDPMAGGIMTEIIKLIFSNSNYVVEPVVLPWQRMKLEFNLRNDWVIHGIPESFGEDTPVEMSKLPIFPFNHSAVTLKEQNIHIEKLDDLKNRQLILVENFHYNKLDDYIASVTQINSKDRVQVIRAFTPAGTLRMLKHKRGDVVIDWQARLIYNLASAGLQYDDVEFHDATKLVPTKNVHLAFSPNQPEKFRTFINTRIEELRQSQQLSTLVKKYYHPATAPIF